MFSFTLHLNQPLDSWKIENLNNMNYMFYKAYRYKYDICWDISNVKYRKSIFLNKNNNDFLKIWKFGDHLEDEEEYFNLQILIFYKLEFDTVHLLNHLFSY